MQRTHIAVGFLDRTHGCNEQLAGPILLPDGPFRCSNHHPLLCILPELRFELLG